jgi:hypothetical protein
MPNIPITINVDFTGVTYSNGAWAGTPGFNAAPDSAPVHNGNNNITWTLAAVNPPTGYTAGFTSDGIVFKVTNQQPWNNAPTLQADGTITASANFARLSADEYFYYTTKVQLTPQAGINGASNSWTFDPDVVNEGGNALVKTQVKLMAAR